MSNGMLIERANTEEHVMTRCLSAIRDGLQEKDNPTEDE